MAEAAGLAARQAGNAAFGAGDMVAAVAAYTSAIAANPGDALAWSNRAAAHLKAGWHALAYGDAVRAAEIDPKNVKARLREGEALEGMAMWDRAVEAYARLLPPGERSPAALAALAAAAAAPAAAAAAATPEGPRGGDAAAAAAASEARARVVRALRGREAAAAAGDSHAAIARLPPTYRGGEGGARSPAAVLAVAAPYFDGTPLAVRALDAGGFGVFATRAIPAGTVVYVDTPLVSATLNTEGRCHHCMRTLPSAFARVPCPSCEKQFCSAACATAAAAAYHRPLCGAGMAEVEDVVRRAATTPSAYFPLLALKLWGAAVTSRRGGGAPAGGAGVASGASAPADTPPVSALVRANDVAAAGAASGALPMSADFLVAGWHRFRDALGRRGMEDPAADMGAFCAIVAALQCNAIGVRAAGESRRLTGGVALMAGGSFFNHSCAPSLRWSTDADTAGHAITFTAVSGLAAGEEATIAYVPLDADVATRRARLAAQYGFDCTCPRCTTDLLLAPPPPSPPPS